MAAPTNTALVKKVLANSEPSTHGPSRHFAALRNLDAIGAISDSRRPNAQKIYGFTVDTGRIPLIGSIGSPSTVRRHNTKQPKENLVTEG
jgi:hypothetical protein